MMIATIKKTLRDYSKPFWIDIGATLLERLAYYTSFMFLAAYLSRERGIASTEIGALVMVLVASLRFFPTIGGHLADRYGYKIILSIGCYLSAIGCLFISLGESKLILCLLLLIWGMGGGLIQPTLQAIVAKEVSPQKHTTAFATFWTAINIGAFIASLLGAYIARHRLSYLFIVSSFLYVSISILISFLYKESDAPREVREISFFDYIIDTLKDRRLILFTLVTMTFNVLYAQLFLGAPLYATKHIDPNAPIGLILTINSLIFICFQIPLAKIIESRLSALTSVAMGTFIASCGIGLISLAHGFAVLLLGIAIFTVGEMFYSANIFTYVSQIAPKGRQAFYMGFFSLSFAVGEGIGSLIGGSLLDHFQTAPQMTWIILFLFGLVGTVFVLIYRQFMERPVSVS